MRSVRPSLAPFFSSSFRHARCTQLARHGCIKQQTSRREGLCIASEDEGSSAGTYRDFTVNLSDAGSNGHQKDTTRMLLERNLKVRSLLTLLCNLRKKD